MASDLHGVRVAVSSDNFLPARENPVHSFNLPPSALCLWAHARWGHDLSSTGRPSRHRLGPSSCSFCHDVDGSLAHHLFSCTAHINARAAWAHSCGVSPPDVPALARHGWVVNVQHAADNPGPHSLCRARLRTAPTTFLVMPSSFARSFCIRGILLNLCAAQTVFSTCETRFAWFLSEHQGSSSVHFVLHGWALVYKFEVAS